MRKPEKRLRVLIADDSVMVRERVAAMVSDVPGVEVVAEVGDADEAIRGILDLKPEVAVLDIRMPGDSGIDVLREIRKLGSKATVVVLTNYPFFQYRSECVRLGANYFFDKSTEFERVGEVLGNMARDGREEAGADTGDA